MDLVISVIIPTYKEWDRLSKCLRALEDQSFPLDYFEIIIVNNFPDEKLPERYKLPKNAKVISQNIKGSYAARNMGINSSIGKILAFTDSDCLPNSNWLVEGLLLLENGADLVGGEMTFFKAKETDSDLVYLFEKCFSFNQKRNVEQFGISITANLFVKREVFEKIGLFSENTYSGADTQLTKKATESGFTIAFGENAVVSHPSRSSANDLFSKKRRTSGGYFKLEIEHSSIFKRIKTFLFLMRPPIKVIFIKDLSFLNKTRLFFLKWKVEYVGASELIRLSFFRKSAERS